MRSASDWVAGLFAASVCDWAPEAARSAVHLRYAPVTRDAQASRHCSAILSDAEVQRAGRIVTEEGKAQFKQRRAFRRYCGALALRSSGPLERIDFKKTEKGRPYLPQAPDLWFSFSACRHGLLGAWSSTHAIGVDIEDRTRQLE